MPSRKQSSLRTIEKLESREVMTTNVPVFQSPIQISPEEQLLIELVNQSRANPTTESLKYGVELNRGLPANQQLSPSPKQPLAPQTPLQEASERHSRDMLTRDYFAHDAKDPAPNGKSPSDRAKSAGYQSGVGENLAWLCICNRSPQAVVEEMHRLLMNSDGHRRNLMTDNYSDIGVGIEEGEYTQGNTYMAGISTEKFGFGKTAITGVVYSDAVTKNNFYDLNEGVSGVRIMAITTNGQTFETKTGPSGGYTLQVPNGSYAVYAETALHEFKEIDFVQINGKNVKVDWNQSAPETVELEFDVDGSGATTPRDVLLIINAINNGQQPTENRVKLDVNRDGKITPRDALMVIGHLNNRLSNSNADSMPGEGESQKSTNLVDEAIAGYQADESCPMDWLLNENDRRRESKV